MSFTACARLTRARMLLPLTRTRFAAAGPRVLAQRPSTNAVAGFSTRSAGLRMPAGDPHDPHHEESFEEFTAR